MFASKFGIGLSKLL